MSVDKFGRSTTSNSFDTTSSQFKKEAEGIAYNLSLKIAKLKKELYAQSIRDSKARSNLSNSFSGKIDELKEYIDGKVNLLKSDISLTYTSLFQVIDEAKQVLVSKSEYETKVNQISNHRTALVDDLAQKITNLTDMIESHNTSLRTIPLIQNDINKLSKKYDDIINKMNLLEVDILNKIKVVDIRTD